MLVALVYLRRHDTHARITSSFGISAGTDHAYVTGPESLKTWREHDPDFVLPDGTLSGRTTERAWER